MKARRWISVPAFAAVLTASAATTYSPIGCGCVDAWLSLSYAIDRPDIKNSHELTPRLVADGLARKLSGKKVGVRDLPFATSTYDCAVSENPERTIRCRLWLWEKTEPKYTVDYRGFDIIVTTQANKTFKRVTVIPIHHGPSDA